MASNKNNSPVAGAAVTTATIATTVTSNYCHLLQKLFLKRKKYILFYFATVIVK